MNSKERIMMVMRGEGLPDRVPVSIGITEGYPVRFTTGDYLEFYYHQKIPLWKARADIERKFGGDNFLHFLPPLLPEHEIEETRVVEETKDYVVYEKILYSPEGELFSKVKLGRREGFSTVEPYIKSLERDFPNFVYLLPEIDKLDFAKYREAYDYVGDSGSIAPYLELPLDWLSNYLGGPEKMIMAHYEYPDIFAEFTRIYANWSVAFLKEFIRRDLPMDVIQLGGACQSYSVVSPEFFDLYTEPYLKPLLALEQQYPDKFVLQQHTCRPQPRRAGKVSCAVGCGRSSPIEPPPMGDVDLAEAKEKFGKGHVPERQYRLHQHDVPRHPRTDQRTRQKNAGSRHARRPLLLRRRRPDPLRHPRSQRRSPDHHRPQIRKILTKI